MHKHLRQYWLPKKCWKIISYGRYLYSSKNNPLRQGSKMQLWQSQARFKGKAACLLSISSRYLFLPRSSVSVTSLSQRKLFGVSHHHLHHHWHHSHPLWQGGLSQAHYHEGWNPPVPGPSGAFSLQHGWKLHLGFLLETKVKKHKTQQYLGRKSKPNSLVSVSAKANTAPGVSS